MPLVWLCRIHRQPLKTRQTPHLLPFLEYKQGRKSFHLQLRHEKWSLLSIHSDELTFHKFLGDGLEMEIHNLASFKFIMKEMHSDVFGFAGTFGKKFVLGNGAVLSMAEGEMFGSCGLKLAEFSEATLTNLEEGRISFAFVEEMVVIFFRVRIVIVLIFIFISSFITVISLKLHPPHVLFQLSNFSILFPSLPFLQFCVLFLFFPRHELLTTMQFAISRTGRCSFAIVDFVGSIAVFLLELLHGCFEARLDGVGNCFVEFFFVVSHSGKRIGEGGQWISRHEFGGLVGSRGHLVGDRHDDGVNI
mmetsp:Transcript_15301/g.29250  ORF Transcript_15301/g.29250 Transcript_15301/m.29250 type:complete len:304 (+) Transcript_15301:265-1176(+)